MNELKIWGKCRNSCDKFAKDFCLSIVRIEVSKSLSNTVILKKLLDCLEWHEDSS